MQTDMCALAYPLSPELSFSISFFVGLSDFKGFLNAVLVVYFQHYWRVIMACALPLQMLAKPGMCRLQNCLLKGRIMCFSDPPGSGPGKK